MCVAAVAGGFGGARLARVPRAAVRAFVVVAGLVIAGIEFARLYRG